MAAKNAKTTTNPNRPDLSTLRLPCDSNKTWDRKMADAAIEPEILAASTVRSFSTAPFRDIGITEGMEALKFQTQAVHGGDLKRAESMLIAQAHSLDAIFAELARRAALNICEHIQAAEIYMKLALRAQSQCRATLETLATIKNPPIIFAKQANIAHGPQQVNNGIAQPVAHTEEKTIEQTELMEHDHGQWLDTGTTGAAGRSDPAMATVEPVHRPSHDLRQGNV